MQTLDNILNGVVNNKEAAVTVLGFIWVLVAKGFSNVNANPIIAGLQKALDAVAKVAEFIGKMCAALSYIISEAIKSDGFLGKK